MKMMKFFYTKETTDILFFSAFPKFMSLQVSFVLETDLEINRSKLTKKHGRVDQLDTL